MSAGAEPAGLGDYQPGPVFGQRSPPFLPQARRGCGAAGRSLETPNRRLPLPPSVPARIPEAWARSPSRELTISPSRRRAETVADTACPIPAPSPPQFGLCASPLPTGEAAALKWPPPSSSRCLALRMEKDAAIPAPCKSRAVDGARKQTRRLLLLNRPAGRPRQSNARIRATPKPCRSIASR